MNRHYVRNEIRDDLLDLLCSRWIPPPKKAGWLLHSDQSPGRISWHIETQPQVIPQPCLRYGIDTPYLALGVNSLLSVLFSNWSQKQGAHLSQ